MNWSRKEYEDYMKKQKAGAVKAKATEKKPAIIQQPTVQLMPETIPPKHSDMVIVEFSIPIAPITKKNHSQILINSKTKKPFIMPSKQYKQYEKDCQHYISSKVTIDYPVNVKCLFYMPTHRKCDLTNLEEAIDDIMVKHGLLADDNSNIIESHDGSRVLYDKENPRTEIIITGAKGR